MKLTIDGTRFISDITADDKAAYLEHLAEKQISDQTLNIPYPYTESDADGWIRRVAEETRRLGRSVNWAIRRGDGYLIGGIGFVDVEPGTSHRGEIGYWLARPYWRNGIMTEAVRRVADFGFDEFGLIRISAHVFPFNAGSVRVLEKAGFAFEGRLRNFYRKNGVVMDSLVYSRIRAATG